MNEADIQLIQEKTREVFASSIAWVSQLTPEQRQIAFAHAVEVFERIMIRLEK